MDHLRPFCTAICPYCNFNKYRQPAVVDGARFSRALLLELERQVARLPRDRPRVLQSVYFGGGTPSLAPPHIVSDILTWLAGRLPIKGHLEVTLEANPTVPTSFVRSPSCRVQ